MRTEVVTEVAALEPHIAAWDALAVGAGSPYMAPGWTLAGWDAVAPDGAELRVVLAHDDDGLVAIAPFCANPGTAGRVDYRLIGGGLWHRIGPVARPGRETDAARGIAEALAAARPRASLVAFEGVDAASPWPAAVRESWRPRPARYRAPTLPAPVLPLAAGDYEAWFAGRSSNFRKQMRGWSNRLAKAGGTLTLVERPEEAEAAIAAFVALHGARWEGASNLPLERIGDLLRSAARRLALGDRLRIYVTRLEGDIVSVQVFVAAGGEIAYWNGGWDEERAAAFKPSMLSILRAIEDGYGRGERRLDLGGGDHPYKQRFAEGDAPVTWTGLFPKNARYPVTRLQLAPQQLRWAATRRWRALPDERREAVKRRLGRS